MSAAGDGFEALEGVVVIDVATLIAGPSAALVLGDFGADVIKVEHPKGDPIRRHGHQKDGVSLWWKLLGRNKKAITLDLSQERGQELFAELTARADVLIESFRPGTLERWNVGPDRLLERNPRLVVARVSGFGQFGPYRDRPGFGTLAEAMSGFAAMTGEPDGPPTLPPFGLADGITGLAAAIAVLLALRGRDQTGRGQVIDVSIIEPILTVLGPQVVAFDQLGVVPQRLGNRSVNNAPRNVYRSHDGRWVAISTSAQNVAERLMELTGRPDVAAEPWFRSGYGRAQHADLLDAIVGSWIAERDLPDVLRAFADAGAAAAPVYDVSDVFADEQFAALDAITSVKDEELGAVRMQNVMFRLTGAPGAVRWAGRPLGADNDTVYSELLGLSPEQIQRLEAEAVL